MAELLIQSSVLIVAVFLIRQLFDRKISHCMRYAIWAIVLLRLLLPVPIGSSSFSVLHIRDMIVKGSNNTASSAVSDHIKVSEFAVTGVAGKGQDNQAGGKDSKQSKEAVVGQQEVLQTVEEERQPNDYMPVQETNIVKKDALQFSRNDEQQNSDIYEMYGMWRIYSVLVFLWVGIAVCILGVVGISNLVFGIRLKGDRRRDLELTKTLQEIMAEYSGKRRLSWRRKIAVYRSEHVSVPCLYGVFPQIYVPKEWSVEEAQQRQALLHEWVHCLHGDHIWLIVRVLVLAVYWFHPPVWFAVRAAKEDAELACDERVLSFLDEEQRISYGEMLLEMAAGRTQVLYPMVMVSVKGRGLKKRMMAIENRAKISTFALVLCMAAVLVVGSMTFTGCGLRASSAPSGASVVTGDVIDDVIDNDDTVAGDDSFKLFSEFLKANQQKKHMAYYSIAFVGEKERLPVLLVTDSVIEDGDFKVSSGCTVYALWNGKVEKAGRVQCSSSGEWIHINDGMLLSDTHHSVSEFWMTPDSRKLSERVYLEKNAANGYQMREGDKKTKITKKEYWDKFNSFLELDTVIFYENQGEAVSDQERQYQTKELSFGEMSETVVVSGGNVMSNGENSWFFHQFGIVLTLPQNNRSWVQNATAYEEIMDGTVGVVTYYDGIADTDVELRFGRSGQKNIFGRTLTFDDSREEYWSYFVDKDGGGLKEKLIKIQFAAHEGKDTDVVLSWSHLGMKYYMHTSVRDSKATLGDLASVAKAAAEIAESCQKEDDIITEAGMSATIDDVDVTCCWKVSEYTREQLREIAREIIAEFYKKYTKDIKIVSLNYSCYDSEEMASSPGNMVLTLRYKLPKDWALDSTNRYRDFGKEKGVIRCEIDKNKVLAFKNKT